MISGSLLECKAPEQIHEHMKKRSNMNREAPRLKDEYKTTVTKLLGSRNHAMTTSTQKIVVLLQTLPFTAAAPRYDA